MNNRIANFTLPSTIGSICCALLVLSIIAIGSMGFPGSGGSDLPATTRIASAQTTVRHSSLYPRNPNAALPVLNPSDLTYVGAFRVSNQDNNSNPLGYGGHALTYNPANHSLFFGGHDWYQQLCEIGIPATIDLGQTASNFAKLCRCH